MDWVDGSLLVFVLPSVIFVTVATWVRPTLYWIQLLFVANCLQLMKLHKSFHYYYYWMHDVWTVCQVCFLRQQTLHNHSH